MKKYILIKIILLIHIVKILINEKINSLIKRKILEDIKFKM